MYKQIDTALRERQRFVIRMKAGFGQLIFPKGRKTGDHSGIRKRPVNQREAILDLGGGGFVKEKRGRAHRPVTVSDKRGTVGDMVHHAGKNRMRGQAFQTMLRLLYPPRCTICGEPVESDFGLCGPCWRDTPLISGLCCETCGVPLPGEGSGQAEFCDDCLTIARPWSKGRAAVLYRDNGRKLVLALKHGDRHDIVRPAAQWMAGAARPILSQDMTIAPIPLHWTRFLRRRFNQSALLAQAVATHLDLPYCPDLLIRSWRTRVLDGLGRDGRHETLCGAIKAHAGRRHHLDGRVILLVDDVMTSGATLSAATEACFAAGARDVRVLVLARVAKDA